MEITESWHSLNAVFPSLIPIVVVYREVVIRDIVEQEKHIMVIH